MSRAVLGCLSGTTSSGRYNILAENEFVGRCQLGFWTSVNPLPCEICEIEERRLEDHQN
jgi:hypothetical protein